VKERSWESRADGLALLYRAASMLLPWPRPRRPRSSFGSLSSHLTPSLARLLAPLLALGLALSTAACCQKSDPPSQRWDGAAASAANRTAAPKDPAAPAKTETGALNRYFPKDGEGGAKRLFKADRPGYAEADFTTADGKKLTMTINDVGQRPDDRAKFAAAAEKLGGYPYKTFGKNKSQLLVADRFQIDAFSPEVDEPTRRTFLEKTDLAGLAGAAK
jgi:hypothetical protein